MALLLLLFYLPLQQRPQLQQTTNQTTNEKKGKHKLALNPLPKRPRLDREPEGEHLRGDSYVPCTSHCGVVVDRCFSVEELQRFTHETACEHVLVS